MKLKHLEGWWKTLWMRALAQLMPKPRRDETPEWAARPYRVLYLRYDRIGDMILATGLIRAIATSHPTITLDVLASPVNSAILAGNPRVGSILIFHKRKRSAWPALFLQVRRAHYDVVIDGMVLTPSLTTLLLMLATGARYRIGIGGRSNDFIYTHAVPPGDASLHIAEQSGRTAIPFGVDPDATDWRSELFMMPGERNRAESTWLGIAGATPGVGPHRRLLVNLSTAQPRHRWPDDRFIEVLRHIRARNPALLIAVTGIPSESASIGTVAKACGGVALVIELRDVLAMVATADVIFTPDTSIAHAASAFQRPAVVMLRRKMAMFAPYRTRGCLVWTDEMAELSPDDVIAALDTVLGEMAD